MFYLCSIVRSYNMYNMQSNVVYFFYDRFGTVLMHCAFAACYFSFPPPLPPPTVVVFTHTHIHTVFFLPIFFRFVVVFCLSSVQPQCSSFAICWCSFLRYIFIIFAVVVVCCSVIFFYSLGFVRKTFIRNIEF